MQEVTNNLPTKRTETLTRKLRLSLEQGNTGELIKIKGTVTIRTILEGKEPIFFDIKKQVPIQDLIKPIAILAEGWVSQMGLKGEGIGAPFALAVIEREPTWTLLDVLKFFDHITYSQHDERLRIMGNTVTVLKLMEFIPVYEEAKAIIRETMLNEKKDDTPIRRENSDTSVKAIMGKELERIQIRDQDVVQEKIAPDEKFFERTPVMPADKQ